MKNFSNKTTPSLWTRDFLIITIGSIVSMLGNVMAGFAISLFVLDYTNTPFYYALYVFLYTLPQIAAPLLAGPFMDRFSRRKTIYLLDFTSALLYLAMGLCIYLDIFNFPLLALATFLIGTISSVYNVAFTSFYPLSISPGNYSKAYSVSSTLETLTFVMIPIATFLYKSFGIFPILLINSACFLIAALFETHISDVEKAETLQTPHSYKAKQYLLDAKEGLFYLISEKGLLCICIYFAFSSLSGGASSVITLPWFRETYRNGEYLYSFVWSFMIVGRVIGGMLLYRRKLPASKKYHIALAVYIILAFSEGFYLYAPIALMCVLCFMSGILGNTSYNIRISATQDYVPNEKKGRFNGAFLMLTTVGSLAGELLAGALASVFPMRATIAAFSMVCLCSALIFVGGGKKYIQKIYNRAS